MKQQLWIVNSSLLGIFLVACALLKFFEVRPPIRRPQKINLPDIGKKKEPISIATLESIYKNDVFGSYAPQTGPVSPIPPQVIQQPRTTPLPEPRTAQTTSPPEAKKQEFIDPLNLSLKGIVISSDEMKNVAMIADETQKESLYHLGDKIKDAQIIKIVRNRVVFLRANGQQELFFLRKEDNPLSVPFEERWKMIVKQINQASYEIDAEQFIKEVDSVGTFIDSLPLIGTAYQSGNPIGIRVGIIDKQSIGAQLGLQSFDIIVSLNDLITAEPKNRLSAYDQLCASKVGDVITAKIKREQEEINFSYKLASLGQQRSTSDIKSPTEQASGQTAQSQSSPTVTPPGRMNTIQERAAAQRQFKTRHPNPQRQETMMEIRKRLLDNLRARMQNARVR